MEMVQNGSIVFVDYVGKLENGEVFDTSLKSEAQKADIFNPDRNYTPLRVTVGQGQVIPGFEEALMGMKEGESKKVAISPEKAYGLVDKRLIRDVPIVVFQNEGIQPQVGETIRLPSRNGQAVSALIREVKEKAVVLDMNHPLAGETLNFHLIIRKIH